jgi:hypothetical protein
LGAGKPNGLNRIDKIGYGYIYLMTRFDMDI